MASWTDSVLHWKRKLEKGCPDEKILEILSKLQRVPITVELLQDTGIGKVVNGLRKHDGEIAKKAVKVVTEWKTMVCSNDKPAAKTPKDTYNGEETSHTSENKYLSRNSHSSQKSHKYNTYSEELYDPSSSKDDYRDYKQSDDQKYNPNSTQNDYKIFKQKDVNKYNPNSSQEDYRKILLNYQDRSSNSNGDSKGQSYDGHSRYASLSSEEERKELPTARSSKSSKHQSSDSFNSDQVHQVSSTTSKQHRTAHKRAAEDEPIQQSSSKHKSKEHSKSHSSDKSDSPSKSSKSKSKSKSDEHKKSAKKSRPDTGNDGFNSSVATFEDCLGFNDSVISTAKPKTVKSKTSQSKHGSESASKSFSEKHGSESASKSSSEKHKKPASESQSSKTKHTTKEKSKSSHKSSKHKKEKDLFPEALSKAKLKPLDQVDILSTLPEIQPEYKPLRQRVLDSPPPKKKVAMSNEEAIAYTSSRKDRTAVYAGRRHQFYTEVPSLFDCCVKVLIENIDGIGFTGGVPYLVLKPILEKCSPVQLYTFEDNNSYLLEETNQLWEVHLKRDFKCRKPEEGETWRDLYLRLYDEREARLKSVTANISASMAKATPVRQTKLAYIDSVAKPPRNVARKQVRYGTALPTSTPMKAGPPAQATPRPTAPTINAANHAASSSSQASQRKQVVKIAPLMQKTIKFMKNRFRR